MILETANCKYLSSSENVEIVTLNHGTTKYADVLEARAIGSGKVLFFGTGSSLVAAYKDLLRKTQVLLGNKAKDAFNASRANASRANTESVRDWTNGGG